ncbi:DeoR family transcriptional regulator [Saccharopolyspora thermophila]|uniref:DeoR family transcriptional regulator n=1 Tax=Saccharopolyspora thermophila TaxID=89367 RepID=UPI001E3E61C9|nr:DeoR family transcriptional regulator [Saccharopolyspora subtropica]
MPPAASRARRDEIVRLTERTGLASVLELSRRFGVTVSTIRRDLARLHRGQADPHLWRRDRPRTGPGSLTAPPHR